MKRRLSTSMLAILVVLTSIATWSIHPPTIAQAVNAPVSCAPDSGSGSIGGTVTAAGGVPLNSVEVDAYTPYGDRGGYALTNASGNYTINGLIAGTYLLQFKPNGGVNASEWYNDQPGPFTATPVTVTSGGATTGINAQLDPGARFSGQVTGDGSGPIQSAQVIVYDSQGQYAAQAYTDAAGNYTTSPGLPSGGYRLYIKAYGFPSEYYNDKSSLEAADVLTVTAPTVQTGVNVTLAVGGQISGKVTNASTGLPLGGIYVSASGADDDNRYDISDSNGDYTIKGLVGGSYSVSAGSLFDDNLVRQTRTVTVTAPNTTSGINFALAPGGTLTGRVTGTDGSPLKDITVYISNQDGSFQDYFNTNASGVYTATAMPSGTYYVYFRPYTYISEFYNDKPDNGYLRSADPISVTAPNTVTGIDAVLAKGGAIRGKVTDAATGEPIKDIYVEVLDSNGGRIEGASTQADGTYETQTTLRSGSYQVRFNADERFASCAYVTAYYHNKLDEAAADPVNISAPNVAEHIDAQLQRGSFIFGKVTDAVSGAPITRGYVRIYDSHGDVVMFGRASFLGTYHTETGLPSGSYRVEFTDSDGGYIDEFYNDKLTLATANPVVLTAPSDRLGVDFALAKGGLIAGRVTAADTHAPFTEAYIIVYDTAGNEVGYAYLEQDGSYVVRDGLATGNYRVAAVPYSSFGEGDALSKLAGARARPAVAPNTKNKLSALADAGIQPAADSPALNYMTTFYLGTVAPSSATAVHVTAPATTNDINIAVLHGVLLPVTRR
jgi:5-hydroxyisourate hydrolase-like protein (transthyretin family)